MATIFTRIISGEIPCYKIAEDKDYFAFLDANPIAAGHILVIPRREIDNVFDLDEETYHGLMDFSRKIALALDKSVPCIRVGLAVAGTEVPHAHVHVIPLQSGKIDFEKKTRIEPEEMRRIAQTIISNL